MSDELDKITGMAKALAVEIGQSHTYREYENSRALIYSDQNLLDRMRAYKNVQLELESKFLQNDQCSSDDEKYLSKLYSELILNENAKTFLKRESEMLKMLTTVIDAVLGNAPGNNFEDYKIDMFSD